MKKFWISNKAIKAFILLVIFFHFTLTIYHVLPLNPIKLRLKGASLVYFPRFFSQNWGFFAPDPIKSSMSLLVKVKHDKEWYNITQTLWLNHQTNRLSAYDRIARSQVRSIRKYLFGDGVLSELGKACKKGDSLACLEYDRVHTLLRKDAEKDLTKIGSSFIKDLNIRPDSIQLKIRVIDYPKWSVRRQDSLSKSDYYIGIFKYDHLVYPANIFND